MNLSKTGKKGLMFEFSKQRRNWDSICDKVAVDRCLVFKRTEVVGGKQIQSYHLIIA